VSFASGGTGRGKDTTGGNAGEANGEGSGDDESNAARIDSTTRPEQFAQDDPMRFM